MKGIAFLESSSFSQNSIIVAFMFLFLISIALLMIAIVLKFHKRVIIGTGAITIFMLFLATELYYARLGYEGAILWLTRRSVTTYVIVIEFFTFIVIIGIIMIHKYLHMFVTVESLSSGMNQLKDALCIYDHQGIVILDNHENERIAYELLNHNVLNGNEYWEAIKNVGRKQGNAVIVSLADGRLISYEKQETYDGKNMLFGFDVTKEIALHEELQKNNEAILRMNQKLLEYGKVADEAVRQEEFVETKIRIHDMLGRVLVSVSRYLSQEKEEEYPERLIEEWKETMNLMESETQLSTHENPMEELNQVAEYLGIKIVMEGPIPQNKRLLHLLMNGARECITNAVRHGDASILKIRTRREKGSFLMEFTNNGKKPEGEIDLGGGLGNLSTLAKSENAELVIRYEPEFIVSIIAYGESEV